MKGHRTPAGWVGYRAVKPLWPCEYCGVKGCHWTDHDEAVADVNAWQRTARATDSQ